jgi:hypothetical protein
LPLVAAAGELLEDPAAIGVGDGRPRVGDGDPDRLVAAGLERDPPRRRRVAQRVVDDVLEHPAEERGVGVGADDRTIGLDDRDAPLVRATPGLRRDLAEEGRDRERLEPDREVRLLEPRDREEIFDHPAEALGRVVRLVERVEELGRVGGDLADRKRQVGADDRERGLEVVDDELGELPLLALQLDERLVAFDELGVRSLELVARALEPEERLDAREQERAVDRLLEEVVGAGLEPADAVFAVGVSGHEDDRHVGTADHGPYVEQHVDAIHLRHHQVQKDEVRRRRRDRGERVAAALGALDRVAEREQSPSRTSKFLGSSSTSRSRIPMAMATHHAGRVHAETARLYS